MILSPAAVSNPTCILNGHSAHVEEAKAHIARISAELGGDVKVVVTKRGDDIAALAALALGEHRHPVVAGGGDGTVSAVAGKLAGTDTALGVLPMGTLNHFAKDAGIPLNLAAAVRNLFTGQVTRVDVGEVNGRWSTRNGIAPIGTESRGTATVGGRYTIGSTRLDAAAFVGLTPIDPTIGVKVGWTYVFTAFSLK